MLAQAQYFALLSDRGSLTLITEIWQGVWRTCCDPVNGGDHTEGRIHVARKRKHGLVQCGEQRPEDDHPGWRQDVRQGPTHALGGVVQELSDGLQVANLHTLLR